VSRAAIGAALLALVVAAPARAQERERITSREAYDHRAPEDDSADEAARWVPRVLLAPLWLLASGTREITRLMLEPIGPPPSSPDALEPPRPVEVLPVVRLETDRSPALGVQVVLRAGEELAVTLATQHFDDRRFEAFSELRWRPARELTIGLEGDGGTRADLQLHGLGWASGDDQRTDYRHVRGGGRLWVEHRAFEASRLSLSMRLTHHRFSRREDDARPLPPAPGFERGATVAAPRLAWRVDQRDADRAGHGGVAFEVTVGFGADVEGEARWLGLRARAAATVALSSHHDVTLAAYAALTEALTDAPPPFVELPTLGGDPGRLAGIVRGRLMGYSATVASLRYRWGIATSLDASLFVEAGNVFGAGFDDLTLERVRLSFGVGLDSLGSDDHRLGVVAALATDPLVDGGAIHGGHARLFIGSAPR